MQTIALNDTLSLSRLVYGMWRLADDLDTSPGHVQRKIEACLDQGITSFDQADIYGDYGSEIVLGGALKAAPHLRAQMQIVTKCDIMLTSEKFPERRVKHYDTSAAHIIAATENSLRAMSIDHIDLLLIHRPDPFMDAAETGWALDGLVQSGKVGSVGVSNFKRHDWTLLQAAMSTQLATNQIEISLVTTDAFVNGDLAFLQEFGVKPMAWSPLAGGALFSETHSHIFGALERIGSAQGVDATAVAIAWLLAHPAGILPVIGTNDLARIKKMSDATRVDMDRETWFELYEIANGHEVP